MKVEEAIEVLNRYMANIGSGFTKPEELEPFKAYKTAIEALEKQVAKKVKNIRFSRNYELAEHNIMEGECPDCGDTMTGNTFGCYCGSCGVALDWEWK